MAFYFAVLWLPLQVRKVQLSAPKIEVLGEDVAFGVASGDSPSAPQSHRECLWGVKKKSGLGPVGSWRARDEPQLWEGTTLQSRLEGNIGGEHDLV